MGTGEFASPHTASIPMRYAVLLRDLRLSVPVFDDNFKAEEFGTILGALKGLQVRMVNFEHHLDKMELGMSKLEHRIDKMELHMEQLQKELDFVEEDAQPHYYLEDCPTSAHPEAPHRSHPAPRLALEPP